MSENHGNGDLVREAPVVVALSGLINPLGAGGSESSVMSVLQHLAPMTNQVDMRFLSLERFSKAFGDAAPAEARQIIWPYPLSAPVRRDVQSPHWVKLRQQLGPLQGAFDELVWLARRTRDGGQLPTAEQCDAVLAAQNIDVVHFGWPCTFPTKLPFIYEPHDLQHRHFPEFFPPNVIRWREETYGGAIARARYIVCGSKWTKKDIMRQHGAPSSKIAVVPRTSIKARTPVSAEQEAEIAAKLKLPDEYVFYSAMTFAHKNHKRLIRAIAQLRDSGQLRVNLLMTGRKIQPVFNEIQELITELNLNEQVRFLGTLPDEYLTVLYKRAKAMVFPSLFEGLSQSLLEALVAGLPVIGAQQSSVPETVGRAGVFFDALDEQSIATTLLTALTDEKRLANMAEAAKMELGRYGWDKAADTFVALYRSASGRSLSAEQQDLIQLATQESHIIGAAGSAAPRPEAAPAKAAPAARKGALRKADHAFASGGVFLKPRDYAEALQATGRSDEADLLLEVWEQFESNGVIDADVRLGLNARLLNDRPERERMTIGDHSLVRGILRQELDGHIHVGKFVYIGDNTLINSMERIEIGDETLIAHNVNILDNDSHPMDAEARASHFKRLLGIKTGVPFHIARAPVRIGKRCWIGLNSVVTKGVEIGDGTIVSAGSVVTKSLPAGVLAAGAPAVPIKTL